MQNQLFSFFPEDNDNKLQCGCYIRNPEVHGFKYQRAMVPLRHIDYCLQIVNGLLNIQLKQRYFNPSNKFLEVDYSQPIDPNSSIYKFEAQFNNKIIQGVVKEKEQAKKQYQEAKKQGRQAAIGTIDSDSKDILNMEIGNIPPQTEFTITICMLQQPKITQNTFYQIRVPSTISPRFINKVNGVAKIPEHMIQKGQTSGKPDFKWTFKIHLITTHRVLFYSSPSHKMTSISQNAQATETVLVMQNSQIPNKDFTFLFTTQNFQLPNCVLGNTDTNSTLMLSFIPKFCTLNINDAYKAQIKKKPYQVNLSSAKGDYVFFLDRSGSMEGSRIQKAKEALILFLKSLPEDSYFNIISFGDSSSRMFNNSSKYNAKAIEQSIKKISKMSADMGGTEIYDSLHQLLKEKVINGYPRQVFILTDGGVSNTQGVIQMVKKSTKYCRVHTIGIGNGASYDLIQGCAKGGKGKSVMISDSQNPADKIIQLLQTTLTPVISSVKLHIENQKDVQSIVPNPKSMPYILKNQVVNFFITFKKPLTNQTHFSFQYEDSITKLPYKSNIVVKPNTGNFVFVDKMAHFKVLRALQNCATDGVQIEDQIYYVKTKDYKKEAIDYSVKHQVLSEFTAFICVSKQLVDGQYQQFQSKGVQRVKVEQPMPAQYQNFKLSNLSLSNNIQRNLRSYQQDQLDSMQIKCSKMQECSYDFHAKAKKSGFTSGFNLGVGDFFSSVGQKFSQFFSGPARSKPSRNRHIESLQSCKSSQISYPIHIQQTKISTNAQQMDIQSINVPSMTSNSSNVNDVVKLQLPNGSWTELSLIDQLAQNPKQLHELIKKGQFQAGLVITQLVVSWMNKYHNSKQYSLIVKKALNWITTYCQQKGLSPQQTQRLSQIQAK